MSDIHSLPGVTEAKAKSVIRQHRKASFYVKKSYPVCSQQMNQ